jgi:DNA repair exonuclease SbcCD ATPase subunit
MTHPSAQGRQPTIGVTFLAWLNIYQNLKQAIQDVIAPEMQLLRGDIKALSAETVALRQELTLFETFMDRRFDAVDKRFDEFKTGIEKQFDEFKAGIDKRFDEFKAGIDKRFDEFKAGIDKRFDASDARFNALDKRIDGLDKRIDSLALDWRVSLNVHERLSAIEARLEKR